MFRKILIANRGEIAVRIIRACRELGIKTVAVYSDIDEKALHTRFADEAIPLKGNTAKETYLDFEKILDAAKETKSEAIHPGYGFLSENPDFIKFVNDSGLKFIGPSDKSVRLMGNKVAARELMKKHNIPIVEGTLEPIDDEKKLIEVAEKIGFPVLIKAAAGGGGKGMRIVNSKDELIKSFELAQSEAEKSFKDKSVFIEKYILNPKHIEVQIIADEFGNYRHLFERECSLQRRYQKIIEEAPSISITEEQREKLLDAALNAAKACGYYNAGTIEFLFDGQNFYFLEMNTRVQVEHPVTEMITGVDIIKEQIKIASGEKISFTQDQIKINGHAIEARIYAENPFENFMPSFGKIREFRQPSGFGIRFDSGVDQYSEVPIYYDPILAKLIAWGRNREEARIRLVNALKETILAGIITNIPFNLWLLENEDFIKNKFDTQYINRLNLESNGSNWLNYSEKELLELSKIIPNLKFSTVEKTTKSNNQSTKSLWIRRRLIE
ncbi:MAG: acetyl-CoA carboxylase biotin carboxylase subunit [Ignavibacteria bacterium]|jgi:acetyl-CoA carboxylase biotin carboxylase subunit|nr:acetyl-CoA carboxylase biotin carboxylase subunit [Ignavibacteria bacterium]MDH7528153.1 acetyl-CoA carboxylase biotin carboxylase subunit [Ignavibacteria bacterium]